MPPATASDDKFFDTEVKIDGYMLNGLSPFAMWKLVLGVKAKKDPNLAGTYMKELILGSEYIVDEVFSSSQQSNIGTFTPWQDMARDQWTAKVEEWVDCCVSPHVLVEGVC